jgi:hypothetical protein
MGGNPMSAFDPKRTSAGKLLNRLSVKQNRNEHNQHRLRDPSEASR